MAKKKLRVTVWNEYRHEVKNEKIGKIYPEGMHGAIAEHLKDAGCKVQCAWLDKDEMHGLSDELLAETDVLTWWGHTAHGEVKDEVVDLVQKHVLEGMGLIVLHSGHMSKVFKRLMGTHCGLIWREIGEKERLWAANPGHPIAQGIDRYFEIPHTEMYGEPFAIPEADETVFISWFEGGEVFRSGCVFNRGNGKVFYFRPGHETYPIYFQDEVRLVIENGVRYCAPVTRQPWTCANSKPLEDVTPSE